MTTMRSLTLLCLLAPVLAGADPLDVYGSLTGKTVLRPSALPRVADAIIADLTGKMATASKNLDGTGIWFHVATPLTEGELLYAIETTFALHNLAIIPVDDRRIRVGHISEAVRDKRGQLQRVQPR